MAESIEQRVSALENHFIQLFGNAFSLQLLCVALYLEHPEKELVLGKWDFLLKTFPDLASGLPISDSVIEFAQLTAKRFQDQLSKLGEAVDQQEARKGDS